MVTYCFICSMSYLGRPGPATTNGVRQADFVLQSRDEKLDTNVIVQLYGLETKLKCAMKCTENLDCWSFSYQPLTGECIHSKVWIVGGRTYFTVYEAGALTYSGQFLVHVYLCNAFSMSKQLSATFSRLQLLHFRLQRRRGAHNESGDINSRTRTRRSYLCIICIYSFMFCSL